MGIFGMMTTLVILGIVGVLSGWYFAITDKDSGYEQYIFMSVVSVSPVVMIIHYIIAVLPKF